MTNKELNAKIEALSAKFDEIQALLAAQAAQAAAPLPAAPVVVPHNVDPADKAAVKAFWEAKKQAKLAARNAGSIVPSAELTERRAAMAAAKAAAIASGITVKI